jgi:hypothetical protein
MFSRKTQTPLFSTAVFAALAVSVMVVVTLLVEAVMGMESYL